MDSNDHAFLKRAVDLAFEHMRSGEGRPYGAVLVMDGKPVAEGWNSVLSSKDATAHAELMAVRRACKVLGSADLSGAVLYASGEPCPMCLSAMYLARVSRCVYALPMEESARIGIDVAKLYDEFRKPREERSLRCEHLPLAEAGVAFDEWLSKAR